MVDKKIWIIVLLLIGGGLATFFLTRPKVKKVTKIDENYYLYDDIPLTVGQTFLFTMGDKSLLNTTIVSVEEKQL